MRTPRQRALHIINGALAVPVTQSEAAQFSIALSLLAVADAIRGTEEPQEADTGDDDPAEAYDPDNEFLEDGLALWQGAGIIPAGLTREDIERMSLEEVNAILTPDDPAMETVISGGIFRGATLPPGITREDLMALPLEELKARLSSGETVHSREDVIERAQGITADHITPGGIPTALGGSYSGGPDGTDTIHTYPRVDPQPTLFERDWPPYDH